ncbi:MAG: lipoyl(octanoyl) transferase LipB, partial [Acidobacteriaceae bacterium]|nr:lipoyl(octanoyl) transferase LipB [Acidobacteriaceae bacterium]
MQLSNTRRLEVLDLGTLRYGEAFAVQEHYVEKHRRGEGQDVLLFLEHPHVLTMGRNGTEHNVLASPEILQRSGIEYFESNRGGDVTYHGPGQLVGYPILDLKPWKRDVHAYFAAVEQALINALELLGVRAERVAERGYEGVWVRGAKIAAIGIHISRWITSHGFALNVDTDLRYFQYIVPCGLTKPVCSLRSLGSTATREEVKQAIAATFADVFGYHTTVSHNRPALTH